MVKKSNRIKSTQTKSRNGKKSTVKSKDRKKPMVKKSNMIKSQQTKSRNGKKSTVKKSRWKKKPTVKKSRSMKRTRLYKVQLVSAICSISCILPPLSLVVPSVAPPIRMPY